MRGSSIELSGISTKQQALEVVMSGDNELLQVLVRNEENGQRKNGVSAKELMGVRHQRYFWFSYAPDSARRGGAGRGRAGGRSGCGRVLPWSVVSGCGKVSLGLVRRYT